MGLSLPHILLVLVVLIFVFGTKRLPELMKDLAKGYRAFMDGLQGEAKANAPSVTQENEGVSLGVPSVENAENQVRNVQSGASMPREKGGEGALAPAMSEDVCGGQAASGSFSPALAPVRPDMWYPKESERQSQVLPMAPFDQTAVRPLYQEKDQEGGQAVPPVHLKVYDGADPGADTGRASHPDVATDDAPQGQGLSDVPGTPGRSQAAPKGEIKWQPKRGTKGPVTVVYREDAKEAGTPSRDRFPRPFAHGVSTDGARPGGYRGGRSDGDRKGGRSFAGGERVGGARGPKAFSRSGGTGVERGRYGEAGVGEGARPSRSFGPQSSSFSGGYGDVASGARGAERGRYADRSRGPGRERENSGRSFDRRNDAEGAIRRDRFPRPFAHGVSTDGASPGGYRGGRSDGDRKSGRSFAGGERVGGARGPKAVSRSGGTGGERGRYGEAGVGEGARPSRSFGPQSPSFSGGYGDVASGARGAERGRYGEAGSASRRNAGPSKREAGERATLGFSGQSPTRPRTSSFGVDRSVGRSSGVRKNAFLGFKGDHFTEGHRHRAAAEGGRSWQTREDGGERRVSKVSSFSPKGGRGREQSDGGHGAGAPWGGAHAKEGRLGGFQRDRVEGARSWGAGEKHWEGKKSFGKPRYAGGDQPGADRANERQSFSGDRSFQARPFGERDRRGPGRTGWAPQSSTFGGGGSRGKPGAGPDRAHRPSDRGPKAKGHPFGGPKGKGGSKFKPFQPDRQT